MRVLKTTGAGLAAMAMSVMAIAPTAADPRHDHGREWHHHHGGKDDNDAVGGFVLGALIAGGLALALGGKKKEPKPLAEEVAFVPVAAAGAPAAPPVEADQEAAVAACAASAEGEARHHFPIAQVAGVRSVEPQGTGYTVKGDVTVRESYREQGEAHPFRCSVDANAVREISVDGLQLASR